MIKSANGIPTLHAALDAEQQVVGALMLQPERISGVAKKLQPRDFSDPLHRELFDTLTAMQRGNVPIDVVTVKQRLDRLPLFANGSSAYLAETANAVAVASNCDHHASVVAEASRKRRLGQLGSWIVDAAANGHASGDILTFGRSAFEDFCREQSENDRFKPITAQELANDDYRVNWLIDWFLVEGQPCILAGGKKTLKTTLLCDLLLSLAIGCEFTVRSCRRVVFCSGESGLATLQETCRRIARAKGWDLADVPNFTITPDLPQLDSIEDLAAFELFLESLDAGVVAIDPIYLCLGDSVDATNLFKTGALLVRLSQICQRLGITVILAHHTRKHRSAELTTFDPPELEDVAFAGFQEFCRQWVLIGRRERYASGSGEHRLWMNFGGSAGHSDLWAVDANEGVTDGSEGRYWDVSLSKAADVRNEAGKRADDAKAERKAKQIEGDHKAVVDAIAKLPNHRGTKTDLKDAVGLNESRFKPAFAAAIQSRDIVPAEVTKTNGHTYPGYKLGVDSNDSVDPDSPGFDSGNSDYPTHQTTHPDNTPIGGVRVGGGGRCEVPMDKTKNKSPGRLKALHDSTATTPRRDQACTR